MLLLGSYILFSMLLPLKQKIQKIFKLQSHTISSIMALILPSVLIILILMYVFPVIITQLNSLTYLSYQDVFNNIIQQFKFIDKMIEHLGGKRYVLQSIQDTMYQIFNISVIAQWSNILLTNFSNILINTLILFFITFHLLKDEHFVDKSINSLVNPAYHQDISEMSVKIKDILGQYFRGIFIDVCIVMVINSLVLSLLGVKNAILIGILSGIMNIIPYVGPLITLALGLFLGVSQNIIESHYDLISTTVLKITITLIVVNIIDGTIIQPYIFSNVLSSHPLEIFLVIVAAGMMGGVLWMMMIIPLYVILKVVGKELLERWNNWN